MTWNAFKHIDISLLNAEKLYLTLKQKPAMRFSVNMATKVKIVIS